LVPVVGWAAHVLDAPVAGVAGLSGRPQGLTNTKFFYQTIDFFDETLRTP
jgi:hypothetical protein